MEKLKNWWCHSRSVRQRWYGCRTWNRLNSILFVEEIGRRMKEEGLKVVGVTTSSQTTAQAEGLGIPLKAVDDIDVIDVTVDGADEVDTNFNGIKGGGGALLMEKIVATPTKEYIWVVDESKWSINSVPSNCQSKWSNMVQTVFSVSSRKRLQTIISHGKRRTLCD